MLLSKRTKIVLTMIAPLGLAACGGATIGGGGGFPGSGGVPDVDSDVLADIEGPVLVPNPLWQFVQSTGGGAAELSDELIVVQFPDGGTVQVNGTEDFPDATITIGTTTYNFVDGIADIPIPGSGGQFYALYARTVGNSSATFGIFTYGDAINAEGFFPVGIQSDNSAIAGRTGDATFTGEFEGYGQFEDDLTSILTVETFLVGDIVLEVDFGDMELSGNVDASLDLDPLNFGGTLPNDVTFNIPTTVISGDGSFITTSDLVGTNGNTIVDGFVAGDFYGAGADEITGTSQLIIDTPDGNFIGAAGFTALD